MDGFFTPLFILKTNCCSYFLCLLKSAHFKCSICNLHSEIISSYRDLYNVLSPAELSLWCVTHSRGAGALGWAWLVPSNASSGFECELSLCNGIFSSVFGHFSSFCTSTNRSSSLFQTVVGFASLVQSRHRWELMESCSQECVRSGKWWCNTALSLLCPSLCSADLEQGKCCLRGSCCTCGYCLMCFGSGWRGVCPGSCLLWPTARDDILSWGALWDYPAGEWAGFSLYLCKWRWEIQDKCEPGRMA